MNFETPAVTNFKPKIFSQNGSNKVSKKKKRVSTYIRLHLRKYTGCKYAVNVQCINVEHLILNLSEI